MHRVDLMNNVTIKYPLLLILINNKNSIEGNNRL